MKALKFFFIVNIILPMASYSYIYSDLDVDNRFMEVLDSFLLGYRDFLGQFFCPPDNQEMIYELYNKRNQFNEFVNLYYELAKRSVDNPNGHFSQPHLDEKKLARLGIRRIANGEYMGPTIYGDMFYLGKGINFYLFDNNSWFTDDDDYRKVYIFHPKLFDDHPENIKRKLRVRRKITYTHEICKKKGIECCVEVKVSMNWSIADCYNVDYNPI